MIISDYAHVKFQVSRKTLILELLDATIGMLLLTAILIMGTGILYMLG